VAEEKREEKRDHKIYKYTNKINGKVYIGRTCQTLEARASGNGKGYKCCTYFYNAIQKYGWENFEGEIIEEGLNDEEAGKRELYWISEFDSTNREKGYNLRDSDYRTYKDETRKKISDANLGRKLTEEHKRKLSEAKKGKYVGDKNPWWGKKMSEETKEKLRQANIGRSLSIEARQAISEKLAGRPTWNKGKKMTGEFCKKARECNKGRKSPVKKNVICVETGIEYYSITHAAECTGIGIKNISHALNKGEKYTAGGFHWKYAKPPTEYNNGTKIRCVETYIKYKSIKYASECTGIKPYSIREALRNGWCAGGFHWEYVDESDS
jgi:group I intron endonuclease